MMRGFCSSPPWQAGDIGAERNSSALARLIQVGQFVYGDRHWRWNHIFVVTDDNGGTVEALGAGVVRSTVGDRTVINLGCPPGVDRLKVVEFAVSKVGTPYDFLDDVLLGFDCLPPHTELHTDGRRLICSELGCEALIAGGWESPRKPALTKPGDLIDALTSAPERIHA